MSWPLSPWHVGQLMYHVLLLLLLHRKWRLISHPDTVNPFLASFVNYQCTIQLQGITVGNQTFFKWEGEEWMAFFLSPAGRCTGSSSGSCSINMAILSGAAPSLWPDLDGSQGSSSRRASMQRA